MMHGPIYLTEHSDPTKHSVLYVRDYSLGHGLYVYEPGVNPYFMNTGDARVLSVSSSSVVVQWYMDKHDKRRYQLVLYSIDGRKFEIGPLNRYDRHDVVNGKVVHNGIMHSDSMSNKNSKAEFVESCGLYEYNGMSISDILTCVSASENICDLYNKHKIGFVDGILVLARRNNAICILGRNNVRTVRFNGGYVLISNGYILHIRSVFTVANTIITAFDSRGRRCGTESLHQPTNQIRSLLVASGRIVSMIAQVTKANIITQAIRG